MPYDNYHKAAWDKRAYERGYEHAQYLKVNYNNYPVETSMHDAYENGYSDWFDNVNQQEINQSTIKGWCLDGI